MQYMLANYTVTLPELQNLSNDLLHVVAAKPVAVLHQDRTLFYVVGADLLDSMLRGVGGLGAGAVGAMGAIGGMVPPALGFARDPVLIDARQPAVIPVGAPLFAEVAKKLLVLEGDRARRGMLSPDSVQIMRNRLDAHLLPVFGHLAVDDVDVEHIESFLERMGEQESSSTTVSQYLVILRKVLKLALSRKWITELPEIPRVTITSQPRSTFSVAQYSRMLRMARRLSKEGAEAPCVKQGDGARGRFWVTARYRTLPMDMYRVIGFMTNSFVRPSDIKGIKHKHVEIVRGERVYLRLNLPTSKKHDKPIVTLRPAVRIYEQLLAEAKASGGGAPDDYLFLPGEKDRTHALAILNFWLKWVLREAGVPLVDTHGKSRTLYCLRHTAITFRLLYGQGIDMLTLARNARTSVNMIENFYASTLAGEMNVNMLQSRRGQR